MSNKKYWALSYPEIYNLASVDDQIWLGDTLGGFDSSYHNSIFDRLELLTKDKLFIWHDQVFSDAVKQQYTKFDFGVDFPTFIWNGFEEYRQHPEVDYQNFICSFNGSTHVSRRLLTAALNKFGLFNPDYCSKNFTFIVDQLDGHINDITGDNSRFYRKFFIGDDTESFASMINVFNHDRYDHKSNIHNLDAKITKSFVHLVSESMATSYTPYVTEKFLYSVVTRGLFIAYAQPGWHAHVEKYYGFKPYSKIFDYGFDSVLNPIERLVVLFSMLSKFRNMSVSDWQDLYQMESDTVKYNYDHYFSKQYLKVLESHTQVHYEAANSR